MNASSLPAFALMGAGACALSALLLSGMQARLARVLSRLALVLCVVIVPLVVLNDWLLAPAAIATVTATAQPGAAGLGALLSHAMKAGGAAMFPAMLAMLAGKRAAANLERAGRVR